MNTFKKERLKTYFNVSRMTYFQQRRQDIMRGEGHYMQLFVAHKMTRNNALNKVQVAATELPQLLSQNRSTNMCCAVS